MPFAEAGKMNVLFGGDVYLRDTDEWVEVGVPNASLVEDLLDIHAQTESLLMEADELGKITKNGQSISGSVIIPKSATFITTENS